ncbi:MAG: hypothetical protein ACMUIU_14250 [bacterium]
MKKRFYSACFILLCFFLCMGILAASPVNSQFSGFTIAPPNLAIGYGGFFNPYVFWPSSNINAAAASNPLVLFTPPSFDTFGLGNLLGSLTQLGNSSFNPVLGFGNSTLTFGNLALSLGGLSLGLNNPLGSLPLFGLNYPNPLALSPLTGITSGVSAPLGVISQFRTAAQTGTWTGTWTSTFVAFPILFNNGPMVLNIVEDPLLGVVAGTTILQGSRFASVLTEVAGVIVNNVITLEGSPLVGYDLQLICYLTSPTTMNGFYTVLGVGGMTLPISDEGIFNLTLNPVVI